ncbi:ABC transporter related protein [Kribbella flavida DSM 17836]|uniref:ABC transporter related protein n=1 Tax=Kribbella flavida (strain DSM 17836 / JCM 10339 / NBRC 14399) TaxID=479435 RepID=D2PMB1_KRIFD|nr:ABC transporter ATP-binding protein [Kribbella flavida]ADB34479.1 ABC transporter related protein [Kribbella flavida DSM 17836]
MTAPVQLTDVRKVYGTGAGAVTALDGVSHRFAEASFTAVMGPSGSGKSTLLHCAAGLDEPSTGEVLLAGTPLRGLGETALTELRRRHVAFVFQAFNLMPALTVRQNVVLPLTLAGQTPDQAWVAEVIRRVGLDERSGHRPGGLSGGQQQRVAIARALAVRAAITFADEPTGALDTQTALEVLTLLRDQSRIAGQTVVMVTHDPVAASYADRVVFLVDGRIVSERPTPTADRIASELALLSRPARSSSPAAGAPSPAARAASPEALRRSFRFSVPPATDGTGAAR